MRVGRGLRITLGMAELRMVGIGRDSASGSGLVLAICTEWCSLESSLLPQDGVAFFGAAVPFGNGFCTGSDTGDARTRNLDQLWS